MKHFPIKPQVAIVPDRGPGRWLVTVSCADRPGLLSAIARVLLKHELNLIDARITTLGRARRGCLRGERRRGRGPASRREAIVEELRSTAVA